MDIVGNDILFNLYDSERNLIQENCVPYNIAQSLMKRSCCVYDWELQGIVLHTGYEAEIKEKLGDSDTHLICHLIGKRDK